MILSDFPKMESKLDILMELHLFREQVLIWQTNLVLPKILIIKIDTLDI